MKLKDLWSIATMLLLSACGGGGGSGSSGGAPAPVGGASLVVTASGPTGRVANGSSVTLEIVVTNTGSQAATNVATRFFAYAGVHLTGIDCEAIGGAQCPVSSQQFLAEPFYPQSLQYTAAMLPAQASLHFHLRETLFDVTSGPMHTSVSSKREGGAETTVDVAVTTYIVQLLVSGGAVAPTAAPGGTASYVMSVSNAGPDPAANFTVSTDVGLHQSFISTNCTAFNGAVCPTTPSAAPSMTVPSLPVGGRLVFTTTASVAADAVGLVNTVFSAIEPGDRFNSDNQRIGTVEVRQPGSGSFLTLRSDPGELLGQGASYAYTQADATFIVSNSEGSLLNIAVRGNESWVGVGRPSNSGTRIEPGTYTLASAGAGSDGSFSWSGNNAGCNGERSQLVIDRVVYLGVTMTAIDLRFDHTCEGSSAVLHGQLHWSAADTTTPPTAVNPSPAGLWRAPADKTPSNGNYVYLVSDTNDPIGAGKTTLLTQGNALFNVSSAFAGQLNIDLKADADVQATFAGVSIATLLYPGYYGPLQTWPAENPAIGRMSWSQDGLGCNSVSGWFVIDDIRYAGTTIASVDARFEQHCENRPAALRGQIHWGPGDSTIAPGPVLPVPSNLWTPPAGSTPSSGSYIYLESDSGDNVGGGGTYLLTPANTTITTTAVGADVKVTAVGALDSEFVGMNSISRLQPGYYSDLKRFPFNNPTKGGMTVATVFGCSRLTGWFVVDSVSYAGDTLTSIDLRFEQHCEGHTPALHGKIHWEN